MSSKNLPSSLVKELDIFPKYNVLKIPSEKEFQDIYYETRIEKNDSEKIENFQKKSEKNILSRKSTLSELSPLFLDTKRTSKKIDLNSLYDLKSNISNNLHK